MYFSIIVRCFLEEQTSLVRDLRFFTIPSKTDHSTVKYVIDVGTDRKEWARKNTNTHFTQCGIERYKVEIETKTTKTGCQFIIILRTICCNLNVISPTTACTQTALIATYNFKL